MLCVKSAFAVLMMASAATAAWVTPAFYKGLEGPKYTVLKKISDEIELRRYEPSSWVSTKKAALEMDQAMGGGSGGSFMTLFGYISGANAASTKIDMTAPVLTKVEPGQGPACTSTFTVSFYNPYKYQSGTAAPKPTNPAVFINNMPQMDVYVHSFGGFSSGQIYKQKAAMLMQKLKEAKLPFNDDFWFTAGYDSPYTVNNRHNEVWVPAALAPAVTTARAAGH